MKRLIYALILALPLFSSGCVSSMVNEAIDTAEERLYAKFQEQWSPHLIDKVKLELAGFKEGIVEEIDKNTQEKLDRLGLNAANYDVDQSGRLEFREGAKLLKDMYEQNKEKGEPYSLIELLAAFAGIYGGGSFVKGAYYAKKAKNTGDGRSLTPQEQPNL